jgi:hypothetical protein
MGWAERAMQRNRIVVLAVGLALGAIAAAGSLQAQDAPRVTVGGVGYVHYRYQLDADSSLNPLAHQNNFDVDRSYVTVTGRLRDGISTRVTIDVDGRDATDALTMRLKYAYAAWQPNGSAMQFKLGMIQTPLVDYIETLWGYRMQGTVALDRNRYLTSSDIGFSVDGSWSGDRINATAGIYNGEGYSREPGDHRKDVAGRVSLQLMPSDTTGKTAGLRLTGYGHYGRATGGGLRSRYVGMLSYQSKRITLGAEYGITSDSTAADSPETKGRVISAYGVFRPASSRLAVLARWDQVDPNTDVELDVPDLASGVRTRVIAGVSYQLTPDVRVLVDADLLSLEHGSPNNSFNATRRTLFFHTEFRF